MADDGARDQLNGLLKAAADAAGAGACAAEEVLGEFLNSTYKGAEACEAQAAALHETLQRLDWTQCAAGTVDLDEMHAILATELPPSQLLRADIPPRYDELRKVVAALDETVASHRSNVGDFHAAFGETKRRLEELEAAFVGTQVDVDEMPHQPFHDALATFRKCIEVSVEQICTELDIRVAEKATRYNAIIQEQLRRYADEAELVAKTAACRLRAARPEDDEDPWEVPRERKQLHFASPQLQEWFEREQSEKVADDYEEEWYASRRKDVDSVIPRAKRVVRETDEDQFVECATLLTDMLQLAESKINVVNAAAADTTQQSNELLGDLRAKIELVVQAGEEFQRLRREQRERSERDLARVQKYVADKSAEDATLTANFDEAQRSDRATFDDLGLAMDELRLEILERQMKLLEYAETRRTVSSQLVQRLEDQQRRRSRFEAEMETCAKYESLLNRSMANFNLPKGYNAVLADCLQRAHEISKTVFDRQHSLLGAFLNQSVSSFADVSSTLYHHLYQQMHRKVAKFRDLDEKATISRKQREFCLNTRDPLATLHETREAEIRQMSDEVKTQVAEIEARAADALKRFDSIQPLCAQLQLRVPIVAVVDLPTRAANTAATHGRFITRAPRPPLTNLDFGAEDRLVIPAVFFEDDRPMRARAIHVADSAQKST